MAAGYKLQWVARQGPLVESIGYRPRYDSDVRCVSEAIMSTFDAFSSVAVACEGYSIYRLGMSRIADTTAVDITLRWGPDAPDVVLSFDDVYYFEVGGMLGRGVDLLFELEATVLEPSNDPWPDGLGFDLVRSDSLPTLMWFRSGGPAQLSVLAPIATAYREAR